MMLHSAARWLLAGLTAVAIAVQFTYSARVLHAPASNFFSFFTIESNVVVIAALIFARNAQLRGAATVYIAIVGIFFALLLSNVEGAMDSTLPWVNVVLHDVTPVAMVCDWLLDPGRIDDRYGAVLLRWIAFPAAYLFYTMVRGAATGWYPYPFLNPSTAGYGIVAAVSLGIAASTAVIGIAVMYWAKKRVQRCV